MPWNPETRAFDPPNDWPITLDDDTEESTLIPWDIAALGLCLVVIVTTCALFLSWTRIPLATTAGIVLILAGCGGLRSLLERRRPDSSIVDALRKWGF